MSNPERLDDETERLMWKLADSGIRLDTDWLPSAKAALRKRIRELVEEARKEGQHNPIRGNY